MKRVEVLSMRAPEARDFSLAKHQLLKAEHNNQTSVSEVASEVKQLLDEAAEKTYASQSEMEGAVDGRNWRQLLQRGEQVSAADSQSCYADLTQYLNVVATHDQKAMQDGAIAGDEPSTADFIE